MSDKYTSLSSFYSGKDWQTFRQTIIANNISAHGGVLTCAYCGKPILGESACHVHHIKHLTETNFVNPDIALNPDNVLCLHHECHNLIHNRFCGTHQHRVVLVYGSPCAGKLDYVNSVANPDDIVISVDSIYHCLTVSNLYHNNRNLDQMVQKIKRELLEMVKTRTGKWNTAYVVDSMPSKAKRAEFCRVYGAESHLVEATEEDCLQRREDEGRPQEFDDYIRNWFEKYRPD